jgi:hypothetical protein
LLMTQTAADTDYLIMQDPSLRKTPDSSRKTSGTAFPILETVQKKHQEVPKGSSRKSSPISIPKIAVPSQDIEEMREQNHLAVAHVESLLDLCLTTKGRLRDLVVEAAINSIEYYKTCPEIPAEMIAGSPPFYEKAERALNACLKKLLLIAEEERKQDSLKEGVELPQPIPQQTDEPLFLLEQGAKPQATEEALETSFSTLTLENNEEGFTTLHDLVMRGTKLAPNVIINEAGEIHVTQPSGLYMGGE